ncbi:hypothetical protein, partial [Mucilaginibacter psychrotolerans]|uniref:hypothetical protein n=1 Tax=Mucilaginibacter psychrotolerans TaxID=1524096 RepID=UPI00195C9843
QKSRLSGLLQEALEILPFSSSDLLKSMLNLFFPPTFLLDPAFIKLQNVNVIPHRHQNKKSPMKTKFHRAFKL